MRNRAGIGGESDEAERRIVRGVLPDNREKGRDGQRVYGEGDAQVRRRDQCGGEYAVRADKTHSGRDRGERFGFEGEVEGGVSARIDEDWAGKCVI